MLHKKRIKKFLIRLAVLLFWLGVWQGVFMAVNKEILIVSPLTVLERLLSLVQTGAFWVSVTLSFLRIFAGYLLGVVFGSVLAAFTERFTVISELFQPILTLVRSTPVASFIILALVWIKKDYIPVFIVFLIVMPIIWANVSQGISSTDKSLLEMAEIFRFGKIKTLKKIYLNSVLPFFQAGAITAFGLAWKSGVAAEVLAVPVRSIGYNLYRSKINIQTADLFAWTAVVIIISVIFEKLISYFLKRGKKHDNDK